MERTTFRLSLFISLIIPLYLFSQEYKFDHISTDQGLSQATINCIHQDKKGFVWVGTNYGLNRYDSYSFKIYKNNSSDSLSISGNSIVSIAEDNRSNLWIATRNNGLNYYDRELDIFIRYQNKPGSSKSIISNELKKVFVDSKGNVLIGTFGAGIIVYLPAKNEFTNYSHKANDPSSLGDNYIFSIVEEGNGKYWIGSECGYVDLFDLEKGTFTKYLFKENYKRFGWDIGVTLQKDNSGNLWIGTNGNGLYILNTNTKKITPISFDRNGAAYNNKIITSITSYNGNMFVGTDGSGIYIYDNQSRLIENLSNDPGNNYSLSNNAIYSLYSDRAGTLWVGTYQGGLNTFNPSKYIFRHYTQQIGKANSLSNKSVLAIYQDKGGHIWIGTDGGGLNLFNPHKNEFSHFRTNPYDAGSVSGDVVKSILEDHQGNLWIGTYANGLNLMDRTNNRFRRFLNRKDDPSSLGFTNVWAIYEDSKNNLWIGLMGGGLDLMDRTRGTFKHFKYLADNEQSISSDNIKTIFEDKQGNLWIGTEGGGLNLFDPSKNTFKRFLNDPEDPGSIPGNDVRAIAQGRNGDLWVGTANGLAIFNNQTHKFTYSKLNDSIPNKIINGILEDEEGNLWISTNKGISSYNPMNGKIHTFDVNDGLQGNDYNYTSLFKCISTGEMFFGGTNGFNSFLPKEIKENSPMPGIAFVNIYLSGNAVGVGDTINNRVILKKVLSETDQLLLSHRENFFEIEFAALDYISPSKIQYKYILEGEDDNWIKTTANKRLATYMNLNPGNYKLRVRSTNSDGIWSDKEAVLNIRILAPWWKTWVFRILVIIVFGFLVYTFLKIRMRSVRNQNDKLERAVENRTHELRQMIAVIKEKSEKLFNTGDILNEKASVLTNGAASQSEAASNIENALHEVTERSRKNTANAEAADSISNNTLGQLDDVKNSAEKSMNEINIICQKISVLEDIFMQTNILSINASIEAASAGQYGKGFAVIANEVKKLAERSRNASQEIVASAKNGSDVSENSGKIILSFIPEVQKTIELIREISHSSIEQRDSIEQIHIKLKEFLNFINQHARVAAEISEISKEIDILGKDLNKQVTSINL